MWVRRSLLSAVFLIPTVSANSTSFKPPARYIQKGACPFDCCTYRDWKTERSLTLVDRPEGSKTVATVAEGQTVRGITGEVISIPIAMKATHDMADTPIKKGDRFYRLHYAGEGFWYVWYRGKLVSTELDSEAPDQYGATAPARDSSVWWVKIRTRNDVTGWTLEQGQFSNQDACG